MVRGGKRRPGASAVGWALRPGRGGGAAGLRTVPQRRTPQGPGPVGRTCGAAPAGSLPGGHGGAPGGPRGRRGMARLTPRRPGPPEGPRGPARTGGPQGSVAGGAGSGAGGEGSAAYPARQSGSGGRRGRGSGRPRPASRTLWPPGGPTCGKQRRMHAWAGRVMVGHRWCGASWERKPTGPSARERGRGWVRASRWTERPRSCRTGARPCVVG